MRRSARFVGLGLFLVTALAGPGCAVRQQASGTGPGGRDVAPPSRQAHEGLHAVLWAQTAAEYRICAEAAYRSALHALEAALNDPSRSALPVQGPAAGSLPPAVILDIDETVLDNSEYQARLVLDNKTFDAAEWTRWVDLARAPAVPGALDFVRRAADRGVEIFFVSNRSQEEERGTRRNLERLGFPVRESPDTVLVRGERPDWDSDKSSRRSHVAGSYRILLLIGDDLGDFLPVGQLTPDDRVRAAEQHRERWGADWFMLPNPQYGSWERALYGHRRDLSDADILAAKRGALRVWP